MTRSERTIDRRYWTLLVVTLIGAFSLLGFMGREIYRQAPPIPERFVTPSGETIYTRDDVLTGQTVWQTTGGQQLGSIWGHGAYQAPDWTADWLHREAVALLDVWAVKTHGRNLASLDAAERKALESRLPGELRKNTYDEGTETVVIGEDRLEAVKRTSAHYDALFGGASELAGLREAYAMRETTVPDAERREKLGAFFFWTSWAAATERPGLAITYTNNWPHEPLIDNRPSGANVVWSLVSVVLLLAAIGGYIALRASRGEDEPRVKPPEVDPLSRVTLTPSMRAIGKYVGVVAALFVVQVLLGALTAHYTVEGQDFFGLPLGELIPYSLSRTWHIQTAMFWIATAFLAVGLFIAPIIGGQEPRYQKLGVNVLFGALLVVVVGSLAGEYLAIHQKLDLESSFWFGHQGYEYTDLGRFWQIALFTGLVLWLVLMLRALWPRLRERTSSTNLVWMFTGATVCIGLLYGGAFFFSAKTHLTVMEYWRWWVVHLWVEGFFEVFATAAIALVFAKMGLIEPKHGGRAVIASSALFLLGGIPGTLHHLYFSGTPTSVLAVGATFSALEVVPLTVIGYEAWSTLRLEGSAPYAVRYRWPIRFFVGVAFWNAVGAGFFGFLINPPLALYYMQGLNTTPVHAHAALFGVYGLLALGLCLIVARRLTGERPWREGALSLGFWCMNSGLALMIVLSLLPIGLAQTVASVDTGLWYARSADFLQQPWLQALRWARMIGDTVFLVGVGSFVWFLIGLVRGHSYPEAAEVSEELDEGISVAPAE